MMTGKTVGIKLQVERDAQKRKKKQLPPSPLTCTQGGGANEGDFALIGSLLPGVPCVNL